MGSALSFASGFRTGNHKAVLHLDKYNSTIRVHSSRYFSMTVRVFCGDCQPKRLFTLAQSNLPSPIRRIEEK
jgi:hypothetical protein